MEKTHAEQRLQLRWKDSDFASLATSELYAILAARVGVFVVEQDCPYPELDGLDQTARHLWAADQQGQIAAYARITAPGTRFPEPSIGRVITTAGYRGCGLGRELMKRTIQLTRQQFPGASLRISAQQHLQPFYESLGFEFECGPYDEDGIPHVEMLRSEQ